MVGFDDLEDLFQAKLVNDSVKGLLRTKVGWQKAVFRRRRKRRRDVHVLG